jgi:8-oxo-dGTP pyrophosphatase MutT (NUDIX family)
LPKGKIEKNEDILEGAIREVSEETGVTDLTVIKSLPETFHIYKANGRFKLKKTVWFLMRTTSERPLVPQIEENIQKAVWVERQNIPSLMENAYENIKILVNAFDS